MFDSYKKIFDHRGDTYHEAMMTCPHARMEEFDHVLRLADIEDGDTVCDIPAGGGYLGGYLQRNVNLIAVESSGKFLLANSEQESGCHRILCNIDKMALASTRVDKIVSLAGLHHIRDKTPFYREVNRLLKPGGRYAIADVKKGSRVSAFLDQFVDRYNPMGHKGDYLCPRTREELWKCSLDVYCMDTVDIHWRFESPGHMATFCKLLFGIREADEETVIQGIERYLGYTEHGSKVKMNWQLLYIAGGKVRATT